MADQIAQLFAFQPDCLEDFSLASQISQAEAKKFFIERMRGWTPSEKRDSVVESTGRMATNVGCGGGLLPAKKIGLLLH